MEKQSKKGLLTGVALLSVGIWRVRTGKAVGMKKEDLYIRVSTDEQADKGYSQSDYEDCVQRISVHSRLDMYIIALA
jgi:hypothetical protein